MPTLLKQLKDSYQSGRDNIGSELIAPCLQECLLYRRGTGFFSSSALKVWAGALDNVVKNETKIEIICSPKIDFALQRQLQTFLDPNKNRRAIQRQADEMVLIAIGHKLNPDRRDYREKLLAYLIANKQLEIRFAVPARYSSPGELLEKLGEPATNDKNMYHVKTGYFKFKTGEVVGFDGSFNESDSGLTHNIERAQVFKSWVAEDKRRLESILFDIDTDWEMKNEYLDVFLLGDDTFRQICQQAPAARPVKNPPLETSRPIRFPESRETLNGGQKTGVAEAKPDYAELNLWPHQRKAAEIFLEKKAGILEMATGSGKTRTAIEIVRTLFHKKLIETVILVTYGTDLLNQWAKEIKNLMNNDPLLDQLLRVFLMYDANNDLMRFITSPTNSVLIVSREERRLNRLFLSNSVNWSKTLVIHDEVHGLGAPTMINALEGTHQTIKYKLGLSATPDREYDDIGRAFICRTVGEVIFQYPLESAIRDGILCEFDYHQVSVRLTENDRQRRRAVYAAKQRAAQEGQPWPEHREYIELSKIVKKAELKPDALREFLKTNTALLKSSIIFVQDREQGDEICKVIADFTDKYRTYYSGTDDEFLELLSKGEINCLVACERLNEGIDIRSLRNVFLISSDRARLSTIQRIGRCLRKDPSQPNKRASVIDFSAKDGDDLTDADKNRVDWLSTIALTRYTPCQ